MLAVQVVDTPKKAKKGQYRERRSGGGGGV
jgi:hypothetical protein